MGVAASWPPLISLAVAWLWHACCLPASPSLGLVTATDLLVQQMGADRAGGSLDLDKNKRS